MIRLVVAQLLPHTHWSPAHLVPDFLFPSSPVLLSMVQEGDYSHDTVQVE